ncbi:MAG: hypothetical protein NTW30_04980 [Candidatus Aenigmarchaeota archaeon]|nr:hypothetical protein [Candidatus Aenigmarchaeota archaeon]
MKTFEERVKQHKKEMSKTKGIPWTGSLKAVTHINGKSPKHKALERRKGELMHHYSKRMGYSKEMISASKEPKGFRDYEIKK